MSDSTPSVWERLAAPIPPEQIKTRTEKRGGKELTFRYTTASFVRERLDSIVPGEWDVTVRELPRYQAGTNRDGEAIVEFPVHARLTILGVTREDFGSGKDYKAAASDAFKRAAVRFGIGHELYEKDAKNTAPAQRQVADPGLPRALRDQPDDDEPITPRNAPHGGVIPPNSSEVGDDPECPECQGRMWDNRETKRNPKAPDFKCRDRSCSGVIWPPKGGSSKPAPKPKPAPPPTDDDFDGDEYAPLATGTDDIPF